MGTGALGGTKKISAQAQLKANINAAKAAFPLSPSGYFGQAGSNTGVREIHTKTPREDAEKMFRILSQGIPTTELIKGKFFIAKDSEKNVINYRVSSKSGSPAVDINIKIDLPGFKTRQKIHFIKEDS